MCDKVLPVDPEEWWLHLDSVQCHHRYQCEERQREEHHLGQLRSQVRGRQCDNDLVVQWYGGTVQKITSYLFFLIAFP